MLTKQILLPKKPFIEKEADFRYKFVIEGLYPGFGHTLGNSLRRIILSSSQGFAITSIEIENVPHEFYKVEGIYEDCINIILNLKNIIFSSNSDGPFDIEINASGIGKFNASNIQLPADVKIINPKSHILEIVSDKTKFKAKMRLEKGFSFVSREDIADKISPTAIALDTNFSPINFVKYDISNMRVGNRTDFDKLELTIETKGQISPQEIFENSIETLIRQLSSIIGYRDLEKEMQELKAKEKENSASEIEEILNKKVTTIDFTTRVVNVLKNENIETINDLIKLTEQDLKEFKNLGQKGLSEIKDEVQRQKKKLAEKEKNN